jgi:hypothetical protein
VRATPEPGDRIRPFLGRDDKFGQALLLHLQDFKEDRTIAFAMLRNNNLGVWDCINPDPVSARVGVFIRPPVVEGRAAEGQRKQVLTTAPPLASDHSHRRLRNWPGKCCCQR